jgi:hypothetical protein
MKLKFHKKTFTPLGIEPHESEKSAETLAIFEKQNDITLPLAVKEWYNIADAVEIMHEVVFYVHNPALIDELLDNIAIYPEQGFTHPLLHVLYENQGVWHMGALLSGEENPPVFLGYQEDDTFNWELHAHSFSDFIYAWAWDYMASYRMFRDGYATTKNRLDFDISRKFTDVPAKGPTTYVTNPWFKADRFTRRVENNQLFIDPGW